MNFNFRSIKITSLLLRVYGLGLVVGLPVLFFLWPAGFQWGSHPESYNDPLSPYAFMLGCMYVSLGIILLRSAKQPEKHTSIIDYTIISSILHGTLMTVQSFIEPHELCHLVGDVPLLFLMAITLIIWHPKRLPPPS